MSALILVLRFEFTAAASLALIWGVLWVIGELCRPGPRRR